MPPAVNALLFDVFGTVVDWRSGVIREGEQLGDDHDLDVDWADFADAWRKEYVPSMNRVREGDIPWKTIDELHRESLEDLLDRFGVEGLTEAEKAEFNHAWHRLDPWPDVIPGLQRLRCEYFVGTLSNGNVRLLADMAKRAGLPWDVVLSAELAGHYKTDEEAYLTAVDLLDEDPDDVLMVACHEIDLDGASNAGLRTAYVHRPEEWGPEAADEATKPDEDAYDIVVDDVVDLADRLGT
jgi:2-haloacid dehalogenase